MSDTTRVSGMHVLQEPSLNRGTAFTEEERDALDLRGLLPPRVSTQDQQVARILENYDRLGTDLDRYLYLTALQDRNEKLFYRLVIDNIERMMPIIYTPTVGEAALQFGHLYRRPRGLYVTSRDRGRIAAVLENWPHRDVAVIVVSDGERILGLGDLGANGMAIPIGKLSLYTACGGIDPAMCLPIIVDVGTGNEELRDDPLYLGLDQPRLTGEAYDELIDEFVAAVQETFPGALIQFEDFLSPNAYRLLSRYRDRVLAFNDDIQGTAAVALGGLYAAARITGVPLADQTFLFIGAGSAATGIADLIVRALVEDGLSEDVARRRCWLVDSKGLIVSGRGQFKEHSRRYAHDHPPMDTGEAIRALEPTTLIGATGRGGTFTEEIVAKMAELNERPVIFALSNPTSRSECTAEQAYDWSGGRAVFASGSPFSPVEWGGQRFVPGQANNVYIFPGIGLGILAARATRVTDEMFLAAAETLAERVGPSSLDEGRVFPPLTDIREVSVAIAVAVADLAYEQGIARAPREEDLELQVRGQVYSTDYD